MLHTERYNFIKGYFCIIIPKCLNCILYLGLSVHHNSVFYLLKPNRVIVSGGIYESYAG